jgi:hypothetical protein
MLYKIMLDVVFGQLAANQTHLHSDASKRDATTAKYDEFSVGNGKY